MKDQSVTVIPAAEQPSTPSPASPPESRPQPITEGVCVEAGRCSVEVIPAAERPVLLVAAYCRVSTDLEEQEGSLEAQIAHWTEYITAHGEGWSLVGVYSEQGLSATHAETRPVLMELLGHCREGKVNLILTKSISRFSRNTVDCLSLVRALKTLSVSVRFEKENIDTGSMTSELFLTLLASFAAEESRTISKNIHMGYTHRFLSGTYKYVRPPYGYTVVDGQLIPDNEEAAVVQDIFDLAIAGKGPTAIADELNSRGISTKYNATWMGNTITSILGNITYTGDSLWQKTYRDEEYKQQRNDGELNRYYLPDHHEPLISREVFVLANQTMGYGDPYSNLGIVPPTLLEEEEEQRAVTVIKAKPKVELVHGGLLRVAAYCRVSTDQEDQEGSYEAQCSHYRALIQGKKEWSLAGIYADEGISGTNRTHREQFNRMVEDAEAGKIDLILTKSISRFARNTLDCLTVVRKLKGLGIGITFEKEGVDTLDGTGEVILTIMASIAQQESASISQNVRMGIQYRFQQGIPMVNCARFLGYDKNQQGKLVINEVQAGVVRRIFRDYLDGYSMDMISYDLRREGVPSGSGNTAWPVSSVRYILTNEKYAGDLLLQKFFVEDFLTHKTVRNQGQLPQYFVEGAHAPIVPRIIFDRVADEIYLRGEEAGKGGRHFGSRQALKGRTTCSCGCGMIRFRRKNGAVYKCPACGWEVTEAELRRQVLNAWAVLPGHRDEIEAKVDALETALHSADRKERAIAQRAEWRLRNLLPQDQGMMEYCAACYDECDFRARTSHAVTEWSDGWMIRVLVRVVAGVETEFNGGVIVQADRIN